MAISTENKEKLFRQLKHSLGYPTRKVELVDEQLCSFLEMVTEDYIQYIQEWLIENQWQSVFGQNIDTMDMAFALSVRSQDYVNKFTYAYSKQQGLQSNGPWELKKDFINIEAGRQVYQIPAGREINEVLWITPPTTRSALFANMGSGADFGFGGGFSQTGAGGGTSAWGGNGGYYIAPAFDTLLMAADMNLKNRIARSELVYKITAGPEGTKLLHLLSVPGSNFTFGHGGVGSSLSLIGCQVWYHYYDTTPENRNDCRTANPDIILLPNEVPLYRLDFGTFNDATKIFIRQLFIAEAKRGLGRVRGKFGGIVGPPEAERTMDYESLLAEGNEEKRALLERLDARLLKLSTTAQLERAANEAEYLNRALKHNPMGIYVK
jgi:hypothetical protein